MEKTEKINLIEVGRRVRAARKDCGLTGEQLGAMIARSQNTISKIERGLNSATPDNIRAIARACGVSEDYLWLRSDFKTESEAIRASVEQMQKDDVMWTAFLKHIALFKGYQMVIPDRDSGEIYTRDTEYLAFEKDGKRYALSLSSTNFLIKDVVEHSGLALQMRLERGG